MSNFRIVTGYYIEIFFNFLSPVTLLPCDIYNTDSVFLSHALKLPCDSKGCLPW